jgi:hypothetical protein
MTSPWERLQRAFIDDHRAVTRGYRELIEHLQRQDLVAASHAASRLDTLAGPHIEFEEKYLYPQASAARGDRYLSRLYDEHEEILEVLVQIAGAAEQPADAETVEHWVAQLRQALDHASACGTMLSELKALPESEQRKFLDGLMRLRQQGNRWSDLPCQAATAAQ